MCSDVVIQAKALSKCFELYDRPSHRLWQFVLPRMTRLFRRKSRNYFKEFWALRDVGFEVRQGETVAIVGRNGSGKSTLLQMLCGTLAPTSGRVEVKGRVAALLELGSGFNPDFTGRENIHLNGAVLGMSDAQLRDRFDDIVAFADIGDFIDQPLKSYSSGMAVRLAFSVATHADADILIVDEALSVGDFAFQAKCMRRLGEFVENGGTLLFVSHDITAVKNLCQRAIYLRQGELRANGGSEEVCEQYLSEANRDAGMAGDVGAASTNDNVARVGSDDLPSEEEFARRVAPFRRHASEICAFVGAGVYDEQGHPAASVRWGQAVTVRTRLRVNFAVDEIVVAMYLRDRLQIDVLGTNTEYEAVPLKKLEAGDIINLDFQFTNYLRAGEYGVCLIAADRSMVTSHYFDWIDLAAQVQVADRPGQTAWAIFNPAIRVARS